MARRGREVTILGQSLWTQRLVSAHTSKWDETNMKIMHWIVCVCVCACICSHRSLCQNWIEVKYNWNCRYKRHLSTNLKKTPKRTYFSLLERHFEFRDVAFHYVSEMLLNVFENMDSEVPFSGSTIWMTPRCVCHWGSQIGQNGFTQPTPPLPPGHAWTMSKQRLLMPANCRGLCLFPIWNIQKTLRQWLPDCRAVWRLQLPWVISAGWHNWSAGITPTLLPEMNITLQSAA